MPLTSFDYSSCSIGQLCTALDQDGCAVLKGVVASVQLAALQVELDRAFDKTPMCQGNFFGFATKRISSVLATSEAARGIAVNDIILGAMDHFLGKNCEQYQLNLTQGIRIYSGEPAQVIHTDDLMFPFELPTVGDQKMINCMWAVDDFTEANGATLLVPGSHKWPRDRRPEPHEIIAGEMPAGSVLIYFGSLLHGGGANRSNHPRTGLVVSYCLGWLRQAENHYLALPRDLVASFPERLQRLVGYFVHQPNLGALQGRDPIEVLQAAGLQQRFQEYIPSAVDAQIGEYRKQELARVA